jgi:hypothetical protein
MQDRDYAVLVSENRCGLMKLDTFALLDYE